VLTRTGYRCLCFDENKQHLHHLAVKRIAWAAHYAGCFFVGLAGLTPPVVAVAFLGDGLMFDPARLLFRIEVTAGEAGTG
jgi:hypothetical protein